MSSLAPTRERLLRGMDAILQKCTPARYAALAIGGAVALGCATFALWSGNPPSSSVISVTLDRAKASLERPPDPPPMLFRNMSPAEAEAFNRALPFSREANPPAKPFRISRGSSDYDPAISCLAVAEYFEASGEGPEGEEAVAQVILNRVRHPAFPATICGVVYEGFGRETGCQFTFTCDGSLRREPDRAGWSAARAIAARALDGKIFSPVGWSTHYHTKTVVPYWASSVAKMAQVGSHLFYRWPGLWGRPPAFRQAYQGEPWQEWQLRSASRIRRGIAPVPGDGPTIALHISDDPPDALAILAALAAKQSTDALAAQPETASDAAARSYRDVIAQHPDADVSAIRALLSSREQDPSVHKLADGLKEFASSATYRQLAAPAASSKAERARVLSMLLPLLSQVQSYSGVPLGEVAFRYASDPTRLSLEGAHCIGAKALGPANQSLHRSGSEEAMASPQVFGSELVQATADYLARTNLTRSGHTTGAQSCSSEIDQNLVAAMLVRLTSLRNGDAIARTRLQQDERRGYRLVPTLAGRLKAVESGRGEAITLQSVYADLVAGLSSIAPPVAASAAESNEAAPAAYEKADQGPS